MPAYMYIDYSTTGIGIHHVSCSLTTILSSAPPPPPPPSLPSAKKVESTPQPAPVKKNIPPPQPAGSGLFEFDPSQIKLSPSGEDYSACSYSILL